MRHPPPPGARAATQDTPDAPSPSGSEGEPSADGRSLERALGARVRTLRRSRDLSVSDLAGLASISIGMLSKIENGQISPSLATLQGIATGLGLPMAALFTVADDRLHCSLVRADEGVTIERRGSRLGHAYQLLGHVLGGGVEIEPYLITLGTDALPFSAFQHAGLELIHMLSGRMAYRHDDAVYELAPGDTLLFDSAALHGPQDILERPTTFLSIIVSDRGARPVPRPKGRSKPTDGSAPRPHVPGA